MTSKEPFETVRYYGVVPVVAIDNPDHALPLADALLAGGLPLIEVTFRTQAAAEAIRQITRERPGMLVGAGTVLTGENVRAAAESGARFAVAPGLNPDTVSHAKELDLPFVPGICTPSDIEAALALGCQMLKFFPAEAAGGVGMVKALAAPYAHTGVHFLPTGGISRDNLAEYLSIPTVAAVGGTWLAKKEHLAAGDWDGIAARCREAVEAAKQART